MRNRLAAIAFGGTILATCRPRNIPTLAVLPASRSVTIAPGHAAPGDSAGIIITGADGALYWTATAQNSWTAVATREGRGSAVLIWRRITPPLEVGTYVDTITVTVNGAVGSPAMVIDSIVVTSGAGGAPIAEAAPPGRMAAGANLTLGPNTSLHGFRIFPASDPWNQPVDTAQVDPNSNLILSTIGLGVPLHPDFGANWNGGPFGLTYLVVPDAQPRVPVKFSYASESDRGPYPLPPNTPIEKGDAHVLLITQHSLMLYETFGTTGGPPWAAGSGAIFDLVNGTTRPAGWTSADAAGLPIMPGLVRYDEVHDEGVIRHALRFTVTHSRKAYVAPARHFASPSTDARLAPMGMRVRLKASIDISKYPPMDQVILKALKRYGMIVADNGGNFYVSGTADARWNDDALNMLKTIKVGDFEVVRMEGISTP
jgi:hypothetical protein